MLKFNVKYKDINKYPITLKEYLKLLCKQIGLELGSLKLVNEDYKILGNPFTNNEDCKTVLSNIAQLCGGFAHIGRDNKVYIISLFNFSEKLLRVKDIHFMKAKDLNILTSNRLSSKSNNANESLDGNNYLETFTKNDKWGEVNSVILRISGTDGENTVLEDETSIQKNGLTELVIEDNSFLINEEQRKLVINNLYKALKGIKYIPFSTDYYGYPYLDTGDLIELSDIKDNKYYTYVFNHTFKYNGSYSGKIETKALTKTQTAYKNTVDAKTKFKQTERTIDKINGKIEDIIKEVTETTEKISKVTQDVDGINQTVSKTIDFTVEVNSTNELLLIDSVDFDILKFIGYAENVDDVEHFNENLKFKNSSYPKFAGQTITFVVDTQTRVNPSENKIEFKYDIAPLKKYNDVSDQFVVEYDEDNKICNIKILRYISKSGNVYTVRNKPVEELLDTIDIKMFKDTTYLYLKEYTNWNLYAKYMSNPNLNEYYASKVELSTQINQTAEEIELVAEKKIDKTELGTYITQNAEAIQIAWNQISQYLKMEGIEGKATFNIYDKNNKMLMSLSQDGQKFYKSNGEEIGTIGIVNKDNQDILAFAMNVDWERYNQGKSMAWGYTDKLGNFLPIFYLIASYGAESSEYGGELALEGKLIVDESVKIIKDGINFNDNGKITGLAVTDTNPETGEVVGIEKWMQLKADHGIELLCNNEFILNATKNGIYTSKPFNSNKTWTDINGTNMPITVFNTAIKSTVNTGGGNSLEGVCVLGLGGHTYQQYWNGSALLFSVDGTYIGDLSDKRLKTDFKEIDDNFLNAIEELEIQQFKIKNRNGKISFGIIAQDLIEAFKKYDIDPEQYEILGKIQYDLNSNTEYYKIEYTQFLVLKQLASDKKIKKLEEKDKQKDEIIANLIKRVEAIEGGI